MPAADYPYLLASLLMVLALVVGIILAPDQRRAMLVSGALATPYALSSVLFVPEYWQPNRIACFIAGPEDLLFSFAGGGLIWLLATRLVSPAPRVSLRADRVARRYLTLSLSFFALVLALKFLFGLGVMTAVIVGGGLHFVVLLALRPDLGRFAVLAGVGYCAGYTLFCVLLFAVWPHFLNQWNLANLTGLTFLDVPIEESVWALVFATCWALAMGYAFEADLTEQAEVA